MKPNSETTLNWGIVVPIEFDTAAWLCSDSPPPPTHTHTHNALLLSWRMSNAPRVRWKGHAACTFHPRKLPKELPYVLAVVIGMIENPSYGWKRGHIILFLLLFSRFVDVASLRRHLIIKFWLLTTHGVNAFSVVKVGVPLSGFWRI